MNKCLYHGTEFTIICPDCEKANLLKRQAVAIEKQSNSTSYSSGDTSRWVRIPLYLIFGSIYWWYLILLPISEGSAFVGVLFFFMFGWIPLLGLYTDLSY